MNLKYYLRGLGLGIVMTAIIMGIASSGKKETLTNEEIMEKAKELGMLDDADLAEYLEEVKTETEERVRNEIAAEYAAANPEGNQKEISEKSQTAGQTSEESDVERETEEGGEEETEQEGMIGNGEDRGKPVSQKEESETAGESEVEEPVVFTVRKGETPYSIGKRMEEDGLLPKDADFDRFLVDNGYDRKIVAAEYEIPVGADMEMIAQIITKEK